MLTVVGDSHAGFFTGQHMPPWKYYPHENPQLYPGIRAVQVGPVLAYNVGQPEHWSRGAVNAVLCEAMPGPVLLAFGEIDCRCHVQRTAARHSHTASMVIDIIVKRYGVIISRIAQHMPVAVWGPIASTPRADASGHDYEATGTVQERNAITAEFNARLAAACVARGVRFASIFEAMLDGNGGTRAELLSDGCHLGPAAEPLVFGALAAMASDWGLDADMYKARRAA